MAFKAFISFFLAFITLATLIALAALMACVAASSVHQMLAVLLLRRRGIRTGTSQYSVTRAKCYCQWTLIMISPL